MTDSPRARHDPVGGGGGGGGGGGHPSKKQQKRAPSPTLRSRNLGPGIRVQGLRRSTYCEISL
jgi:hypothetical protein